MGMWWYRFCVETAEKYERRGERTAAQIWWIMRDWEEMDDARQLTHAEGFEECVSQYLDYKLATVPQAFDYVSKAVTARARAACA